MLDRIEGLERESRPAQVDLASKSPAMREAVAQMEQLAAGGGAVLIAGEPGTEKELFARALHVSSTRESKPFAAKYPRMNPIAWRPDSTRVT